MNLTLGQISDLFDIKLEVGHDIPVNGASIDTRNISPGDLFFALPGEHVDGHNFINAAFKLDASAAVVSRDYDSGNQGVILKVADTLAALQKLAEFYRSQYDIPVVALTGSNGKTTTKEMISSVLSTQYKVAKTPGNLNNHIGLPLSICSWESDIEVAVLEMGTNHFGEIARLCKIAKPTHALITNIGKGHLEFFGDSEGVAKAKKEILEGLSDTGTAFLNGDDPLLRSWIDYIPDTITFGFSEGCSLQAENFGTDEYGFPAMVLEGHKISIPLPGEINLMNGMAAAAVGLSFNISWENITAALTSIQAADQRMHLIILENMAILNDCYNANPSSMEQSFQACGGMDKYSRKIAILGDMKELGRASEIEHLALGEKIVAAGFDALFAVGPEMKYTVDSARKAGMAAAGWFESNRKLLTELKTYIRANDLILVKGSRSMLMEEIVVNLQ